MSDRNKPKVSVGMPVYNGEAFVAEAIDCVLQQSYPHLELIISDNASTDSTSAICQAYAAREPRIRYIRQAQNIGAPANYNRLLALGDGNYFKWASANDRLDPHYIEDCLEVLESDPDVVLCYGKTTLIDEDGAWLEDYDDRMDLQQDDPCERLMRLLSMIRLNNAFNGVIRNPVLQSCRKLGLYRSSDRVLMAELALHGKFIELPAVHFYRRMGERSSTAGLSLEAIQNILTPAAKSSPVLPAWRADLSLFSVVTRSALGCRQKGYLYAYICRRLCWNRRKLFKDLVQHFGVNRRLGAQRG